MLRACAALLTVALAGTAFAQYGYAPFFDQPLVQNRGYGLELVLQRLRIVDAFPAPLNDELKEQVEEMLDSDVKRFVGTLEQRDAQLAADLLEALAELTELVDSGEDASAATQAARELVWRAYDVVVHPDIWRSPAYIGGLIADLTLGEGGVAEGYEEAADGGEDLWVFTSGWSALQRVNKLWAELLDVANAQQRADVEEMLVILNDLYPQAQPPEAITGSPEEAEAPVQRMLGVIEAVTDAELFAGRDLKELAGHLATEAAGTCALYRAGNDAVALEGMFAIGELYVRYLADFLDFMVPEVHEEAYEVINGITGLESESAEDDDHDEDEDEEALALDGDLAGSCMELQEALEEAFVALGG